MHMYISEVISSFEDFNLHCKIFILPMFGKFYRIFKIFSLAKYGKFGKINFLHYIQSLLWYLSAWFQFLRFLLIFRLLISWNLRGTLVAVGPLLKNRIFILIKMYNWWKKLILTLILDFGISLDIIDCKAAESVACFDPLFLFGTTF